MKTYLIPANSKKSMLIFGYFTMSDLIILIIGITFSLLMLLILPVHKISVAFIAIAPAAFCAFLVMPIPNYHNVRTFIRIAWEYFTTRQKYIWKGWCFNDGEETSKK